MKRFTCIILVVLLALTLGLTACSSQTLAQYQAAVENGYSGTIDEWIALQNTSETPTFETAYESQYKKAVENGYTGDFATWLLANYSTQSGDDTASSVQAATAKALRSVVCIQSNFRSRRTYQDYATAGSGVIIAEDSNYAYIVTNYHVLYDVNGVSKISDSIQVYLYGMYYNGYEFAATYINGSMSNDIAVIKIEKNDRYINSSACVATVADSSFVTPGATAIAVGNPNGEGISVTSGIISIESENIDLTAPDEVSVMTLRVMRIDTPVNPGNSGGGLFNINGELIGIVNAKYIDSESDNIGYAIPSNVALSLAKALMQSDGILNKVVFGIEMHITDTTTVYDSKTQKTYVVQELTVAEISDGAAASGYLQVGDVLKSFTYNGKTVAINRLYTISDYIFGFKKGDTITFTVIRNGEETEVKIPMTNTVKVL